MNPLQIPAIVPLLILLPLLLHFLPLPLPLPLLPMSIALHFVVVDTRAGSQQGNLIVDSPLFCLTHSLTLTSRFPSLFLDFYALLVPCPFHICFSRFLMIGQIEFRLNLQSATAAAAIATSN